MLKMMWFTSLLLFVAIGGCFCDDDEEERGCFLREQEKCEEHSLSSEVPQSSEELLAVCQNLISMGNCLIEAAETCTDGLDFMTNHIRNAIDYVRKTCQEDNPTFEVITNNLPCIERVLKSRPGGHCGTYFSEENLEAIRTNMKPFISDESNEDVARCLYDLMDVTCEGISFGYHCGEEVQDAVEEIKAHVHSPHSLQCTPEQLEELSPFMRTFEDLLMEDLALQNALKRKRK